VPTRGGLRLNDSRADRAKLTTSTSSRSEKPTVEDCQLNGRWDHEEATGVLRAALAEIDALSDELSPARAEALLDEFERDVGSAFLRQDLPAVKATARGTCVAFVHSQEKRSNIAITQIDGLHYRYEWFVVRSALVNVKRPNIQGVSLREPLERYLDVTGDCFCRRTDGLREARYPLNLRERSAPSNATSIGASI